MDADSPDHPRLILEPIGIVRTAFATKAQAARQPRAAAGICGRIELFPGRNFEHALEDLAGWEYLWVIFWFHLNRKWRPKVLPPRRSSGRKGVFATRSPHRPNPIGLSAVRLERVEGLTLFVREIDILDRTPVLDIKPYVAYTDAYPSARHGWLETPAREEGGTTPPDPVAPYAVTFDLLAEEQAAWIEARTGLPIRERIMTTLALGPEPHPYRRIRRDGEALRLAIRDWRVRFTVTARAVRVTEIGSGYRPSQIAAAGEESRDPVAVHRAFVVTWPH
jgi:tRNA-Thr(GGU) m(6)t(6)A37 methyltransferase TsaA